MRLFYDYQVFNWQKYGGISRYFYELISRIIHNPDINVQLFLGLHINNYKWNQISNNRLTISGFKRPQIKNTGTIFLEVNRFLSRFYGRNCDIYHQTYFNHQNSRKAKKIITIYDMIHEKFPELFPTQDTTVARKKQAINEADGIISISETTRRDLIDFYKVDPSKVKSIYLANSLQCPTMTDTESLPKYPYILYVGDRHAYKQYDWFIKAYSKNRRINEEYSVICFGGGPPGAEEKRKLKELSIDNKVIFESGSDDLLATLYRRANVFVYPSIYEGFGLPLLEAMHCGCPVLAARTGSIPEIAAEAATYFNSGDEEDFNYQLSMILDDQDYRVKMIERGRKREKEFSWDKCAGDTYDLYKQVLQQ